MGIRRVAGLAWHRLLMRVDNNTGKGTSSMDKFSSKVHRVHMELGGKHPYSLRSVKVCCYMAGFTARLCLYLLIVSTAVSWTAPALFYFFPWKAWSRHISLSFLEHALHKSNVCTQQCAKSMHIKSPKPFLLSAGFGAGGHVAHTCNPCLSWYYNSSWRTPDYFVPWCYWPCFH